jgi:hypothetical protein
MHQNRRAGRWRSGNLLLQSHSFFLGGIPMVFYGDELGYANHWKESVHEVKNDNHYLVIGPYEFLLLSPVI